MKDKLHSLLRLAVPYILMAVLPLVSVGLLSSFVIRSYTENGIAQQQSSLQRALERVDQKLETVESIRNLIAQDSDVMQYVINEVTGVENTMQETRKLQNMFSNIAFNSDIAQIYLYDARANRLIANDGVFSEASQFFRYQYCLEDTSEEAALKALEDANWSYSAANAVINSRPVRVLEYKSAVPVTRFNDYTFTLVISLNADRLFEDISDAMGKNGEFYVFGTSGLLYSNGTRYLSLGKHPQPETIEKVVGSKESVYAVGMTAESTGWSVRILLPELSTASNERTAVGTLLPVALIPMVFCAVMCIYFTYKNHREMTEIVSLIQGDAPSDLPEIPKYVDHKLIYNYADKLVSKNKSYETRLGEMKMSQHSSVLARLVRNAYQSRALKETAVKNAELKLQDEKCIAMCIRFDDICNTFQVSADTTIRTVLTGLLSSYPVEKKEVFDNTPNEIVCVLPGGDGHDTVLNEIVELLDSKVRRTYGVELHIGIGDVVDSVYDIHLSYEQAIQVIEYNERAGGEVHKFTQLRDLNDTCFYPALTDDKITNYMITGCADEAKKLISQIYSENFMRGGAPLSLERVAFIKHKVSDTVLGVAQMQNIPVSNASKAALAEENVKKHFAALTALVDEIVNEIVLKKKARNSIAERVQEYVMINYANSALSVKSIARYFGFHENYLSNLFKEEYGENLSAVIEKVRIEKANTLLFNTDMKVADIATAVGYVSDSSFRRAYKKIEGHSPAQQRKN